MMKVIFSNEFYEVYTSDPAAARGRMEAVVAVIQSETEFVEAVPAAEEDIRAAHTPGHIASVRGEGLYEIAALAAGGACQAAEIGLAEPCFGLIRPPGHHASADSAWGFCYFNNMSVALLKLKREHKIKTAFVLDFDLHYGDGNANILEKENWVTVYNPDLRDRKDYLENVQQQLLSCTANMIAVSAGFDNHRDDWGHVLITDDYETMGRMVAKTAARNNGGCFGILEGGYNHKILGDNVMAFIRGMAG